MRDLFKRLFGKPTPAAEREEDRFARLVLAQIAAEAPQLRLRYDPERFELVDADASHRTFLGNGFAEWRRTPEDGRAEHLARFVAFMIESRKPRPVGNDALDALLPVVRARTDVLVAQSELGIPEHSRSARPFCGDMLLMLAIDSEASIALVSDAQLDDLGVSFDDALGVATAQLLERGNHQFGQLADGVFVSTCGDHYDASRVLLPELVAQLPVQGNPVVIVQARSALLVTGSEDEEGLEMIAGFVLDDFADNERAVSLTPIEWVDGSWQPLTINASHPPKLRSLPRYQRLWEYGASHDRLQALLGDAAFVANPLLVEKDGEMASLASWASGCATACPMVDAIALQADGAFTEITRSLDDVVAVLGPFPPVEAMPYPPRLMLPATIASERRRILTEDYPDFLAAPR